MSSQFDKREFHISVNTKGSQSNLEQCIIQWVTQQGHQGKTGVINNSRLFCQGQRTATAQSYGGESKATQTSSKNKCSEAPPCPRYILLSEMEQTSQMILSIIQTKHISDLNSKELVKTWRPIKQ